MPMQPLLALCEEQCASYERELALIDGGAVVIDWTRRCLIATTPERVSRIRASLAELYALLVEHGKRPAKIKSGADTAAFKFVAALKLGVRRPQYD